MFFKPRVLCLPSPVMVVSGRVYHIQWPFQDPRLEVPTIYKAYISGLCKGISLQNMALYGTVPPFKDPEIPIDVC